MKATFLTLLLVMWETIAVDMWESFCGVLNTQRRFSSTGSTMRLEAAQAIIGVCDSAATSIMPSELGEVVEPSTTSTLSSETSLRMFLTALVVSEASSRTM